MNNTQKWFIVVAVGCISALGIALMENSLKSVFDIFMRRDGIMNWVGCVLFGLLCSSITGFFLFKDKK